VYSVYEYFGGQLYRGAIPQATLCCIHEDQKRSAKVMDDYYKCYAGCGGGDVIWLLKEKWEVPYGVLIKKANEVFKLGLRDDPEVADRVLNGGGRVITKKPEQVGQGEVLDRMKVNRVYRTLLEFLPFSPEHREKFIRDRNLPAEVVDKMVERGYRTYNKALEMPLIEHLVDKLGSEALSGVPGFYREQGPWRFNCSDGVLFPVLDISGLITALLVRSDQEYAGKYMYVTSTNYPRGTKANYGFHVIRNGRSFKYIWVIEGILKADVVSLFMEGSGLVCGLPSLSGGRSGLLKLIQEFDGAAVFLCMDSDWRSKPAVKKGVSDLAKSVLKSLKGKKHRVFMVNWNPQDGKGMDDVLANVGKKALQIKEIRSGGS
jgi:hypothetical protein